MVLLFVPLIFFLFGFDHAFGILSISNIEKCVQASVNNKQVSPAPPKRGRQMFMYFGDAGIEAVEVFSADEMRRFTALAKCTAGEDNSLFEDRSGSLHHFHDGGSNVTYLTGIFPTLLPDVTEKIRKVAQKAIDTAEWSGNLNHMGIRSVQYLSFYKPGLKAHRQAVKERLETEKSNQAFVIYPDKESRETAEKEKLKLRNSKVDPEADSVVKGYLQPVEPPGAVAFSAVIVLSDRSQFAGGEVLISKSRHPRTTISLQDLQNKAKPQSNSNTADPEKENSGTQAGYDLDEDSNFDDPEPEADSHHHHHDRQEHAKTPKKDTEEAQFEHFSAAVTTISRFTPEMGNLLLLHGEHSRGLRPVLYGRRNALIVEFWAYTDGKIGAKRPLLSEAQPFVAQDGVRSEL